MLLKCLIKISIYRIMMGLDENCVYLKETKYLNYLLRSICILTRIPRDENPSTSTNTSSRQFLLLEWMYTITFYAFLCFIFFDLIYTQRTLKTYINNPTMDSFNNMLILLLSACIVLLSLFMAIKANGNREKYIQLWREYQIQYDQYTMSKLTLDSSNFIVTLAISGTILTTLELGANCVLTSQSTPIYVSAYWLIYFYTNFTTVLWVVDCHLLTKASEKLLDKFLSSVLDKANFSSRSLKIKLFQYTELWRKLSEMTGRLMDTSCGRYELHFVIHSVIVIQAFYGIVAMYMDQQQSIKHNNSIYFSTAVWSIVNLVVLCEAAYSVTAQVGFKTKVPIQLIPSSNFNLETQEQIFTVLKTIQSDMPEITVGGYFIMDRTYIISYLGAAISYIIVLVQFKIGTS